MLVPGHPQLCKGFRLNHRFPVDMPARDGIENVVGLVVGWTSEPELTHRKVDNSMMLHAVTQHGRGHRLGTEDIAVRIGQCLQVPEEILLQQLIDGLPDILQKGLGLIDGSNRNSRHGRKPAHRIIAVLLDKGLRKSRSPVLAATFPAVHMEAMQDRAGQIRPNLAHNLPKPLIVLQGNGRRVQLVHFEAQSASPGVIGVAG